MLPTIIKLKNVGEKFRLYHQKNIDLKARIFDFIKGKMVLREEFWALKDVSFEIQQGEVVGIIGENGSGKTTVLNLIAGILKPDEGEVKINGRVSALLELGTGFHPELSGRENIYLYGAVLGLSKKTIDAKFDEMVRFAELEKFIDAPVKTYSAGMYVRLGFAVAINVDTDILLIDEVLAVGDVLFQRKCIQKIEEFKIQGKTIIFVSHNMSLVSWVCNRVIFLREGRVISDTPVGQGIGLYMQTVGDRKGIALLKKEPLDLIFNNGRVLIYWNTHEITKNFGFYSSIRSSGMWHDSTCAKWQLEKINETKMKAFIKWPKLPINQIWEIEILNNSKILWKIEMEVYEPVQIEREQTNIMLTENYLRWFTGDGSQGEFPEEFNGDYGGDWQSLWKGKPKANYIGVSAIRKKNIFLPSIGLSCPKQTDDYVVNIVNSDMLFKARVLQCLRMYAEDKKEILPCKYTYFIGQIKINSLEDKL